MAGQFDWSSLKVLLAVHRAGSAREAAKTLGVHAATIYRAIRELEDELDVLLFERRSHGYSITPAGEELLALSERMERETEAVALRLAERTRDWVEISLPGDGFAGVIAPALRTAMARHEDLVFRVETSDDERNIADHETDIAIRITRDPPLSAVGRRIGPLSTAVYGSPERVARAVDDVEPATWISWPGESYVWDRSGDAFWAGVPEALQVPNHTVALSFAAKGCGFVAMACCIGDPVEGLVRYPGSLRSGERDMWVLIHEDARRLPRIHGAARTLSQELFARRASLGGGLEP